MGKALLLVCAGLFLVVSLGCETAAYRSASVNTELACAESLRVLGLDRPSMLYMRDTTPVNYYTPYR